MSQKALRENRHAYEIFYKAGTVSKYLPSTYPVLALGRQYAQIVFYQGASFAHGSPRQVMLQCCSTSAAVRAANLCISLLLPPWLLIWKLVLCLFYDETKWLKKIATNIYKEIQGKKQSFQERHRSSDLD